MLVIATAGFWPILCILSKYGFVKARNVRIAFIGLLISTFGIILEPPHKQSEWLSYMAPRALMSVAGILHERGLAPSYPSFPIIALTCAILGLGSS